MADVNASKPVKRFGRVLSDFDAGILKQFEDDQESKQTGLGFNGASVPIKRVGKKPRPPNVNEIKRREVEKRLMGTADELKTKKKQFAGMFGALNK